MWTFRNPVRVNNNKIMKIILTICSVGQKPMSTFRNPARVKLERWVLSRWTDSCIIPWHRDELIQLNMYSWIYNRGKLIQLNICTKNLICNAKEKYAHTIICLTILQSNMHKNKMISYAPNLYAEKNISLALHQKMIGSSLQRTLIGCWYCILASYGWDKWELLTSCR